MQKKELLWSLTGIHTLYTFLRMLLCTVGTKKTFKMQKISLHLYPGCPYQPTVLMASKEHPMESLSELSIASFSTQGTYQ